MIARLQRLLVMTVLALAGVWWWWSGQRTIDPAVRAGVTLLILLPHAPALAVEFMLLAIVGDHRPAPRPTPFALLRAWAGEVVSGVATFGWRQPFRANAEPDHLPTEGRPAGTGVLLVHGFVCNRGLWNPWMRRLRAARIPFLAVNLEPPFGSIGDYAAQIEEAVARLQDATGQPPLIVGHSMGGLAARDWLRRFHGVDRCAGVVTIGSPHHGTWLARFAFSPNGRQMRRGGDWLAALAATESGRAALRFTCFYGHCDNIVFPAATAMLPDADNRHLPGMAHVHMLSSRTLLAHVLHLVDEANAAARGVGVAQPASGPYCLSPGSTTPASISGSPRSDS